jgi:hypothetical protein
VLTEVDGVAIISEEVKRALASELSKLDEEIYNFSARSLMQ